MKIDLNELHKRSEFINTREHEELGLHIWNYNEHCQYERAWDDYTRIARGIITDGAGNIIQRPFPKFFNVGETEESQIYRLPPVIPEIREKLDGSLGIQYYNDEQVCIATRGSFHSDQALWATAWMAQFARRDFRQGYTYLYEIIYPGNRIIVDYGGYQGLILLAAINIEDLGELDIEEEAGRLGIKYAKLVNNDIWQIYHSLSDLPANEEGFVAKYPNGLRVKLKGHEYCRIQKLIATCSTTAIWEIMAAGGSVNIFTDNVPAEIAVWVETVRNHLQSQYDAMLKRASDATQEISRLPSRKDQAAYTLEKYPEISALVFAMLDGKDVSKKIWRLVKPEYRKPELKVNENAEQINMFQETRG